MKNNFEINSKYLNEHRYIMHKIEVADKRAKLNFKTENLQIVVRKFLIKKE